jgi:alkanesulfonate monooxygenase SsuD/methylene tetrahydromethanopterin reductase-like flavin-dependent oxidoreductase (luciferase family)
MLGFNVFAADTDDEADLLMTSVKQSFLNLRHGNPGRLPPPDADFDSRLTPPERSMLDEALACSVAGSAQTVSRGLKEFVARTGADEIMVTSHIFDHAKRLRSFEIVAGIAIDRTG